jgi:hypothetical protein
MITAVLIWQSRSRNGAIEAKAFYTDDDGRTWFVDDAAKLSPFDHQGKLAFRCYVYQTAQGMKFVVCEAKLPDEQRKALINADTKGRPPLMPSNAKLLLKQPGETEWHDGGPAEALRIFEHIKAPDGSGSVTLVSP